MNSAVIFLIIVLYFGLLFLVAYLTSRRSNSETFYVGNKQSPWFVVAFGMIGASLSGVTFMSVPGWVGTTQFTYMMIVVGYLIGYAVVALVLLPLYYRLNLTSIYTYLHQRFGFWSYKTGAFFFLLSRAIGASFRMFIVINVLQIFIFDAWNVPFWVTVLLFLVLVIIYTYQGGIKTIVWTDTFQTVFMLLAVVLSIWFIAKDLNVSILSLIKEVSNSEVSNMVVTDWSAKNFFLKQILSGMFITITMTGLDQEMMQKNLSCRNLREAQKNMFTFSFILVFVNLMFLFLGAILLIYSKTKGISVPGTTDDLFPTIALNYLTPAAGVVFMIGLVSAAFPSADGALTSLTTSFCVDFLGLNNKPNLSEAKKRNIRYIVHFSFAALLLLIIVIYKAINDQAIISKVFTVAGYTYGPLLGLYSFGLFLKRKVNDKFVPLVAVLSPIICYVVNMYSEVLFNGYKFGFEILILNGAITFIGLLLISSRAENTVI
ncbi:MAG TPA: sodium:solute symporter [Bacteroidales bacterium]|nr:sodium:solute symporter [Bacteroidales bacterium]